MQFGGDGEDGGSGGLGEAWTLRRSYTLREKAGVRQTDPKCYKFIHRRKLLKTN